MGTRVDHREPCPEHTPQASTPRLSATRQNSIDDVRPLSSAAARGLAAPSPPLPNGTRTAGSDQPSSVKNEANGEAVSIGDTETESESTAGLHIEKGIDETSGWKNGVRNKKEEIGSKKEI